MKFSEKVFWKVKNHYDVLRVRLKNNERNLGMLAHRPDERDLIFGGFFDTFTKRNPKPKYNNLGIPTRWQFIQTPFNICTMASNILASSYQEGMRFSIKACVQQAVKNGDVIGNGFSYVRAPLNIAVNTGRLPVEMMPDDTFGMTWRDYSKYELTDTLKEEMGKYKTPSYQKVTNAADAVELLEHGYCLLLALVWHQPSNRPQYPEFLLVFSGPVIGSHAIFVADYVAQNGQIVKYTNFETFGEGFGDDGKAYLKTLFGEGLYDVYFMEKIADRTDTQRIGGLYDELPVKGKDSTIYLIRNNEKCPFSMSFENYLEYCQVYLHSDGYTFYQIPDEKLDFLPTGESIT